MILVLLGTQNNSFKRLVEEIDNLIEIGIIKEEVVVQAGYTKYETKNMKIFSLIQKEELEILQEKASLVITHGGVGSIISSIQKGKKVIAIPRLHEYLEHVNNHQKEIVEYFTKKGNIIGVFDIKKLGQAIKASCQFEPIKYKTNNSKMLNLIEDFIEKI